MGRDEHTLLLTLHHIVSDAWSNPILMQDLTRAYVRAANGDDRPLPRPAIQYADYAHWQREVYPGSAAFERPPLLAHLPGHGHPAARPAPRPGTAAHRPATARQLAHDLPGDLVQRLGARCQALGVAPFVMLLGAWQLLLARYSGQRDTVGVPNAGRNRAETQELVGCFVNTHVYKARIDGAQTGLAFLQGLRQQSLAAMEHADYPIEYLLEHLDLQRSAEGNPLFQTLFNWRVADAGTVAPALAGLSIEPLEAGEQDAKFDLSLDVESSPHGLRATLEYRACAFDEDTVARIARHWQHLLQGLVEHPERPSVSSPPSPSRNTRHAWRRAVARSWRRPCSPSTWPSPTRQGRPRGPGGAVRAAHLSYAELERQANRLAHRLLAEGVGPEVRVGIALPRCPELVIALLAVLGRRRLRAAGPGLPARAPGVHDRRQRHRRAAHPGRTGRAAARPRCAADPGTGCGPADLERGPGARRRRCRPPRTARLHDLHLRLHRPSQGRAGAPWRAEQPHAVDAGRDPLCAEDRVLQKTAISFDASVWEFWLPLMCGAQLVLGSSALAEDLSLLWREVAEHRITHLQMAPR